MADSEFRRVFVPGQEKPIFFPASMSQTEIENAVRKSLGVEKKVEVPSGEGDKATSPTTPESIAGNVLNPGQPKPLDMVQKIGNTVLPPLATAPVIAAAGEVAPAVGLAAPVARSIASGALGGAKAASAGENIPLAFIFDALTAGAFEGAGALAPNLAKVPKVTSSGAEIAETTLKRREGFDTASKSIDLAFDAIKPRVPAAKFLRIPALSNNRLTVEEAREGFKGLKGKDFQAARQQLLEELKQLDKRAAKRMGQNLYTAKEAGTRLAPERFQLPESGAAKFWADLFPKYMAGVQSGVNAEASSDTLVPGIPTGALPAKAGFDFLAEHLRPKL